MRLGYRSPLEKPSRRRFKPGDPDPFDETVLAYGRNILVGTAVVQRLARGEGRSPADYALFSEVVAAANPRRVRVPLESAFLPGLRRLLRLARGRLVAPPPPRPPVARNLSLVCRILGFSRSEKAALQFLVAQRVSGKLEEVTDAFPGLSRAAVIELIAAATASPRGAISDALAPKGRLVTSGIVKLADELGLVEHKLDLDTRLLELVLTPKLDRDGLLAAFLPLAPPPSLALEDFPHAAEEVALARRLLAAALQARKVGVNLLLYGPTGTGKTELARLLAREVDAQLHVAGTQDEAGHSPDARERLASLLVGNRLLASARAVLLFDEMEDLFEPVLPFFSDRSAARMSKQWFNQLLETNPVPAIWVTNDASSFDPAFRRRFSYAIEFRPFGARQRRRAWERHLGPGTALPAGDLERLAARFPVSAAEIGGAVAAARLLSSGGAPDRETLEAVLAPAMKLGREGGAREPVGFDPASYRPDAVAASVDLEALATRLARFRPGRGPGISLCLHGLPGTGKSEWVHHLAHRLGSRVVARRVSEIESKWVGESERNLAAAFAEAAQEDAVLLFDEADSFLRDRREARAHWELSIVNEFLQQLEAFPGIVACTTNLYGGLDPASLRRFTFKVEFRPLSPEQALRLFETLFAPVLGTALSAEDAREVERELRRLGPLVPGDLAAVARRLGAMGDRFDVREVLQELAAEAAAKQGPPRTIGF